MFFPRPTIQSLRPSSAWSFVSLLLVTAVFGWAEETAPSDEYARNLEDVTTMPKFELKAARLEDFGFRYESNLTMRILVKTSVWVKEVFPNTPASKAGLRPGDLILKIEGQSMSFLSKTRNLRKMQDRKWTELARGKETVTYSLEVRTPGEKAARTITMVVPSPPPHWGSKTWSRPEGRPEAIVKEPGPLAALARDILDNGIWSAEYNRALGAAPANDAPLLGYEWRIVQPSGMHRIWATQQFGKTQVIIGHHSSEWGEGSFVTSPSGAMESGHGLTASGKDRKQRYWTTEETRARFDGEIDFWLTQVGRVTGRWPFEALSGATEVFSTGVSPRPPGSNAPPSESFLKLPVATEAQKGLFLDAVAKVGLEADGWAYTETSRSLDDGHTTTVRFDPSKPPDERTTLLKVNGKKPTASYLKKWQAAGPATFPRWEEFPSLLSIVDMNEIRIYADETAATVFELMVSTSNSDFPAEKFRARVRVNKATRALEDFSVKLRELIAASGLAKVGDAGIEAHFQTIDPTLAPQPVRLKVGGDLRVLFVKVSRGFETARTDFQRVGSFPEQELSGR